MKLFIVAHDIPDIKAHLMPWRTVCEVTEGLRELGHDATLVSLDNYQGPLSGEYLPSGSFAIRKYGKHLLADLRQLERSLMPDVIFWPVSWRDPLTRTRVLASTTAKVVGWFPGGAYDVPSAFYALRRLGLKRVLPYIMESLSLKGVQVRRWLQSGLAHQIAMTDYTARAAIKNGYSRDKVFTIPPGRENIEKEPEASVLDPEVRSWLAGRKYFLFMGPPSAIRGVFELLSAFEKAAKQDDSICLVCLFRSDAILDRDSISATIDTLSASDRIYVRWESVSPEELNGFIKAGYVTVMPFVMVPSEIPLAVIETARWGKPVITTSPGGTGEYVEQFGSAPRVGDIDALAEAMLELSNNSGYYQAMSKAANVTYLGHPTWKDVSLQWFKVAEQALEAGDD